MKVPKLLEAIEELIYETPIHILKRCTLMILQALPEASNGRPVINKFGMMQAMMEGDKKDELADVVLLGLCLTAVRNLQELHPNWADFIDPVEREEHVPMLEYIEANTSNEPGQSRDSECACPNCTAERIEAEKDSKPKLSIVPTSDEVIH
jgi:hypothetical protein